MREFYRNGDEDEDDDDPNDPDHRDFDLSDAGGDYYHFAERPKPWFTRRWVLLLVAAVVIAGLVVPMLPR